VSRFYKDDCFGGPYKLFGISKGKFENILRYLQENANGIVSVELSADLENIFLREDLNSNDILDILIN
jgi:phosphoadenosine phosphosulfate reductase